MIRKTLSQLKKYIISLSVVLLFTFLLAGCNEDDSYSSGGGGGTPGANEVFISNMSFSPANKTISAGTTITWTNKDGTAHTVTSGIPGSPSGVFDSGNKGNGQTFSFTFTTAGEFKYFCDIHHSMTGTITVQ